MKAINMPQVGQDVPSARIIEWRKQEGERVREGEILLVVESDKASFEVESDAEGVLLKRLYAEGEEADILTPVAYVGEPGEEAPERTGRAAPETGKRSATPVAQEAQPVAAIAGRVLASPSARRIARERDLDLSTVAGTGPGGRVIKRDVTPAAAPGDTVIPFGKLRLRLAERLSRSAQTIPHFYVSLDVDMTDALIWRREFNTTGLAHVTVTDLVVKAAATALRRFPRLNAHGAADRLTLKADVNVGVAVAVEDGLLVPVVAGADALSVAAIARVSAKNAQAARRGIIASSAPGTFTVSSLGMHRVSDFRPIINPPECAILAVGTAAERVVAREGAMCIRRVMTLTLGCDHRAVDGAYAAGFLNEVRAYLEDVDRLAADAESAT